MSTKTNLTEEEKNEVRSYIKKLRKEGSTTAGVPGFLTAAAWSGEEGGDGTTAIDVEDEQYSYSIKASEKKPHFVKLHEANYKTFKEDSSLSEVQKVNRKVLEVNRMLREISQALDHSMKLKTESSLDNSRYWKKTNEAILKMKVRIGEVNKKVSQLANLKELAANSVKDKLVQIFNKAGLQITAQDLDYNQIGSDWYEFDVMMNGEPIAIDYKAGEVIYQDYDEDIRLGNFNQEQQLIQNISKEFNP
tara:strand:- start:1418 stop:2161 length:744 start_codon:yes stop_codon:yes gene_type:complete